MRKILILAANPRDTTRLRLGNEVRAITEGLKRASHRDEFTILQRWAVRPRDLQRAMLEETPQIVHFSGHGGGTAGLYFEDELGNTQLVTGSALAGLFRLIGQKAPIDCVVLNGCYSQAQAEAIVEHVPYVIGMRDSVGDRAALEFAVGFYDALGSGDSVEFAFEAGKVAMALHSTGDESVPVLLKGRSVIVPEVLPETKAQPKEQPLPREEEPPPQRIKQHFPIVLIQGISLGSAVITLILRLLGLLSSLELTAYDFFMRPVKTDDRIVIVGIRDDDLDKWQTTELSDRKLLKILEKINTANPNVVGLDIFRDELQKDPEQVDKAQEHYNALVDYLEKTSNKTVSICLSNARASDPGSRPPFEINDNNRSLIGFSDIIEDPHKESTRIRRQLLRMNARASACNINRSLSYRIALTYLKNEKGITEEATDLDYIKLDKTIFVPVFSGTGGYSSDIDDGGQQILINYRVKEFKEVSAFEIYNTSENSELLEELNNKIVLVGYISNEGPNLSNTDVHNTPIGKVAGVELQAHMVRNIISSVYGEQPLIVAFPINVDLVITIFLAFLGGNSIGFLIWFSKTRNILFTVVAVSTASILSVVIIIVVGYWFAFELWGWWLPLIPSVIGWIMSASSVVAVDVLSNRRGVKVL